MGNAKTGERVCVCEVLRLERERLGNAKTGERETVVSAKIRERERNWEMLRLERKRDCGKC